MKYLETIIDAAADADFTKNVYTRVYASNAASPIINGTEVGMQPGVSIEILVKSISATAQVFVLGKPRLQSPNVING